MAYDPDRHHRRSIRLRGYDYAQAGTYFVTVVTHNRVCLFGEVADGDVRLNDYGEIVHQVWAELPQHYYGVELDAFVVMPNHVHGIVMIVNDNVGAGFKPAPTGGTGRRHSLPEIVRGLKTFSARRINELRGMSGKPVWQRNYYEHVIRDEVALDRIRQYIADNPARWAFDRENPASTAPEPKDEWPT